MLTLLAILSLLLCSNVAMVTLCNDNEIVSLSGFQLPAYSTHVSKMTFTAFDLFISTYFFNIGGYLSKRAYRPSTRSPLHFQNTLYNLQKILADEYITKL